MNQHITPGSLWQPTKHCHSILAHTHNGESIYLDNSHTILVTHPPKPSRARGTRNQHGLTPVIIFPLGIKADIFSNWFNPNPTPDNHLLSNIAG